MIFVFLACDQPLMSQLNPFLNGSNLETSQKWHYQSPRSLPVNGLFLVGWKSWGSLFPIICHFQSMSISLSTSSWPEICRIGVTLSPSCQHKMEPEVPAWIDLVKGQGLLLCFTNLLSEEKLAGFSNVVRFQKSKSCASNHTQRPLTESRDLFFQ